MADTTAAATTGRVVAGVDGSDPSRRALVWAADAARRRAAVLVPVLAWSYLDQPRGEGFRPDFTEADARACLDRAVADALGPEPGVALDPVVVNDIAAAALLDQAHGADLVVLGDRGRGGFAGLRIGSVSENVSQHSPVPVVVVRASDDGPHGRVVVGVDISRNARVALAWAAAEARRRNAVLEVVHTWTSPAIAFPEGVAFDPNLITQVGEAAASDLEALVAEITGAEGDLTVETNLVESGTGRALVERSHHADLVVVGTRGRGGVAARLLGSVSRKVLHAAACPVAVVPVPGG